MTTMTHADDKIRELLLLGNSVDVLTEQGPKRGWTRADVLRVASANGWQLDPSGRIPRNQRTPDLAPTPARPAPTAVAPPGPNVPPLWSALISARASSIRGISKRAERLHLQLVQLSADLAGAAEEQKVRERLAELDAERDQLRAKLSTKTGKPGRKPKPIDHGTVGGYQTHKRRGEPMCDPCQTAGDNHMNHMRAAKAVQS